MREEQEARKPQPRASKASGYGQIKAGLQLAAASKLLRRRGMHYAADTLEELADAVLGNQDGQDNV